MHSSAHAQRADDNAVTAAEDAFGATLGEESIGLYTTSLVRGFSPVTAGNVRIEGLYFDRQASLPTRLVEGSTVHVGLSAQGYPFPAPTGIVDYRLHKVADKRVISVATGLTAYSAPEIELDVKWPLSERFGVAGGISLAHEEYYDGADARYVRAALMPRWRPNEHVEIIPFWSQSRGRDEEVAPTIVTAGSFAPPEIERRKYFGQTWADNELNATAYGVLGKGRVGEAWAFSGGVFRSIYDAPNGFAEIYADTQRDGSTREILIADPRQLYESTSGELRASRSFLKGPRLHVIHLSLRGRQQESRYGGSQSFDFGLRPLGTRIAMERPESFDFGAVTHDEVRQWNVGAAYEALWRNVGEAYFGVQRTHYEKRIEQPNLPIAQTDDDPWLISATLALHLTPSVALYGGYTRGLEESGIAPDNASNRNQALPAIRTRQVDGGVRWTLTPGMKLVAGVFDIRKPYFTTDDTNLYTTTGDVTHRGAELSIAGSLTPEWNLIAGTVLMEPRVEGLAVDTGRIGRKPVGVAKSLWRANVDYRPAHWNVWSFDVGLSHTGERVASSDGAAVLPSYTLVDLGARYRMTLGKAPATLRLQALNITDEFAWNVFASNSYGLMDARRYVATLFVDF